MAETARRIWALGVLGVCVAGAWSCTALLGDDFEIVAGAGASSAAGSSSGGGGTGAEGGDSPDAGLAGAGGTGGQGGAGGSGGSGGTAGSGGSPPTLSEQRVLYWSNSSNYPGSNYRQIHSMRLDGTDARQETDTGATDDVLFGTVSADGSKIAYTLGGDIWIMDGDGSNLRQLTTNASNDYRPALNVDGTLFAFVSERNGARNIYFATTAQGDAGPVTQVTDSPQEATFPQFSPDSQWITYTNYASGDIYRVRTDGTEPLNLTNYPGADYCSAYSPDGTKIVFTSERDGWSELYVMNANGSGQTRITQQDQATNLSEAHASFDMTGQWLVYYAYPTGENQSGIYRTSIDGSTTVRLTPQGVGYSDGKLGTWTYPDG